MYEVCIFKERARRSTRFGGWPPEEGQMLFSADDTHCQGLVSMSLFPIMRQKPREGGRKLTDPIKGQRRLTFCLEMSA